MRKKWKMIERRSNIKKDKVEKQGQRKWERQKPAKVEEGAGERARGSSPSDDRREHAQDRENER
jgi:hypothetical protein